MSFLHKINQSFGDKTSEKDIKSIYGIINRSPIKRQSIREKKEEIQKEKKDIQTLKEEIKTINEYNKKVFDYKSNSERKNIRNINSRFENVKSQYDLYKKEENENKTRNKIGLISNTKIKLKV